MSNTLFFVAIAFTVFASNCASPIENATKVNSKGDAAQSSPKSVATDSSRGTQKFAASVSDQENARTYNKWKPAYGYNQYPFVSHIPYINKKPLISHIFQKPSIFHQKPAPAQIPYDYIHPFSVKPSAPVYTPLPPPPPVVVPHPVVVPQPVYRPPKPSYVVSQQIIHRPVVTEHVEVVRRPVLSEVVQVLHKPVVHEEVQVVKIPTYVHHVIQKPIHTSPVKNELQGPPIHVPGQHVELSEKPTVAAVTNVVHVPHAPLPSYGTGTYSSGYGIGSTLKPGYYTGSVPVVGGIGSSYSVNSGYGGASSGYGTPSYGVGSGYGSGTSSYNLGSGYGGVYDALPSYTTAGISPSYVQPISAGTGGYSSDYGVSSGYVGEADVLHSYIEPSHGCRSGDDCKPTSEEVIAEDVPEASSYPPAWLYNNPYEVVQQPSSEGRAADESDSMMVVMVPVNQEQQQSDAANDMLLREFLAEPEVRSQMSNMFREYTKKRTTIATEKPSSDEKPTTSARSSAEDDGSTNVGVKKDEDAKLTEVIGILKTSSPGMLKQIGEKIHEMQTDVAKNGPVQSMVQESPTSMSSIAS